MQKTVAPGNLVVEKFGINNRRNKFKETTMKNVEGAARSTKQKFPCAKNWIPLVNYLKEFPQEEKDNLNS